jgi:hypothetical protein
LGIFFWNFSEGIFLAEFLGGIFWEKFFGRIFRRTLFYFNVEEIDLFVKILVFVKILSKSRRRNEGGQI